MTNDISGMEALANSIVGDIEASTFAFVPKRGNGYEGCQGWRNRFRGYKWGDLSNEAHWNLLSSMSDRMNAYSRALHNGGGRSSDSIDMVGMTLSLFEWGHVTRGKGHNPPTIEDINAVIQTAWSYTDVFDAPLDSAWTKLAAIASTHHTDEDDKPPQVIFDSRVAVALLDRIERVVAKDPKLQEAKQGLKDKGMGYIAGRGGNRKTRIGLLKSVGWTSAYGRWSAQFLASQLVSEMVKSLNKLDRIGRMPAPDGEAPWNTRGVEMVLFMDGY